MNILAYQEYDQAMALTYVSKIPHQECAANSIAKIIKKNSNSCCGAALVAKIRACHYKHKNSGGENGVPLLFIYSTLNSSKTIGKTAMALIEGQSMKIRSLKVGLKTCQ